MSIGAYLRFTSMKERSPQIKTMLSIGGWNEGSKKYSLVSFSRPTSFSVLFTSFFTRISCSLNIIDKLERLFNIFKGSVPPSNEFP